MAGTHTGGIKARNKNLASDPDFYKKIGSQGGRKGAGDGVIKGFAANLELASRAGRIGGLKSRRNGTKNKQPA